MIVKSHLFIAYVSGNFQMSYMVKFMRKHTTNKNIPVLFLQREAILDFQTTQCVTDPRAEICQIQFTKAQTLWKT